MLRALVARLERIVPAGEDIFDSEAAAGVFDRIYGGQNLAEALMAAAKTVGARDRLHSAHCRFLRLGDPRLPMRFRVERLHDARSFTVRQVRAEQADRLILIATFSFAAPSEGIAHQWPAPNAPPPEAAHSRDEELIALYGDDLPANVGIPWPIDIRHIDQRPWDPAIGSGRHRLWMRADETLPDCPLLHAALLLYASDLTMADAVTVQHPIRWEDLIAGRGYFGASLDHALWLHAPARVDKWLLHEQESSRAVDGRGFTTGRFFDRSGVLIASVAQEIFIRAERRGET
jgi:acyl-CoA thioesterase-2